MLVRQRRIPEAVSFGGRGALQPPQRPAARSTRGCWCSTTAAADAIEEARQVLRFDERSVAARLAVAEAYRAQGRLDLALYIVNDLINGADPNHQNNGRARATPRCSTSAGSCRSRSSATCRRRSSPSSGR
jgi:hypothetical protein